MSILLDTHALLWWLEDNPKLSEEARKEIGDLDSDVYVSAASAWEISIKIRAGKLKMGNPIKDEMKINNFKSLPIAIEHATAAGQLPRHHGDPLDRMLVAQAQLEGLTLVTRDNDILRYDVQTLLA